MLPNHRPIRRYSPLLEALEKRELLSAAANGLKLQPVVFPSRTAAVHDTLRIAPRKPGAHPNASSPPGDALTPTNIRDAYGINQVMFGNTAGDGAGQTIAIIVAYDCPTALTDVQAFSAQYGLPLFNQPGGPTFQRVAQDGSQNFPGTDPLGAGNASGTWELEAALDVQWAHVAAPKANIILVEATDRFQFPTYPLIQQAVNWARQQPAVSVISMSFSATETSSDLNNNKFLTTPSGHQGITFVAATGDTGTPTGFPATSPNVVSVGGTSLTLTNGQYGSESAWIHSGGGISSNESKPGYQAAITQSSSFRTAPDISLDGDPNTGVAVYDSWDAPSSPWMKVGGTSLSTPLFAGMVAVADQGRTLFNLATLNGFSDTLPKLYSAPAADFHDITTGSNGTYSATAGYDLVTGLGSPIANLLIPYLVGVIGSVSGTVYQDNNANALNDAGDTPLAGVPLYADLNNNGLLDIGGTQMQTTGTISLAIPDNNTAVYSPLTIAGITGPITDVNVTLSITHPSDKQLSVYLVGPDGTQITLFSAVGGTSANFTNTTLDDQAVTSISAGSAPFTGSYVPTWLLAAFNGKAANGTWKLKIIDGTSGLSGTLTNWSVTVATASEPSTTSAANGSYSFGPLPAGPVTIRELPPTGFTAVTPASLTYSLTGNVANANFGLVPNTFTATSSGDTFYLWIDNGTIAVGKTAAPTNPIILLPTNIALTFNLITAGSLLILDFSQGSPLPTTTLQINGTNLPTSELRVLGAGTTLHMTDSTLAAVAGGGTLSYTNLGTVSLNNATVLFNGDLSTLQFLNVNAGTNFYWS